MAISPNNPFNTVLLKKVLRKPRILWATPYCLLDTSSGASISAREMLRQLVSSGYEVSVIGATIFDSEKGLSKFPENWRSMIGKEESILVKDPPLEHHLFVTAHTSRFRMTAYEADQWYLLYIKTLDTFKPDLVWLYGGISLDLIISDEARQRGIPCAMYLANANYVGSRWYRDVDVIITNSKANADYYERKDGIKSLPVGIFIDPLTVRASYYTRENFLFINPSLEKGAAIVIQLAMLLEKKRPEITIEVIESRGNWKELVQQITSYYGDKRDQLDNVLVTGNTSDMRAVYGRARILIAPSLWWESAGRVVGEALLNGIPAIVTDCGGLPEMLGNGGVIISLPAVFYEKPYNKYPTPEMLEPLAEKIIHLYDDDALYAEYVVRAHSAGESLHNLGKDTQRLLNAFEPFIQQLSGDVCDGFRPERCHKQVADPLL